MSITRIPESLLKGEKDLGAFSVAQKFSWAANGQTARPEDRSFSLFGIFNVKYPIVYGGDGIQAFNELQKHIVAQSNEQSIFAWTVYGTSPWRDKASIYNWNCSVFAPSPDYFHFSYDISEKNYTECRAEMK